MKRGERITRTVRALRGGQITIPAEFRKRLGVTEDTLLQMTLEAGELRVKPVRLAEPGQGSAWLKELYDYFAPVRAEAEEKGYTEQEINADIDEAVREVRAGHATDRA
jgi:bifunctional DNA-binding transcriptional regulator/antitoxin component of YhaV-PrlF toxin-antitoxin module